MDSSIESTPARVVESHAALPLPIRLIQVVCGLFFLITAFGKALDGSSFAVVISYLLTGSRDHLPFFEMSAYVIMAWEGVMAVLLISNARPRIVAGAALLTMIVFTAALVRLTLDPLAPDCNCLGIIRLLEGTNNSAANGLIRNGILLSALAWIWWTSGQIPGEERRDDCASTHDIGKSDM